MYSDSLTFPTVLPDLPRGPRFQIPPRLQLQAVLKDLKQRLPAGESDAARLEKRLRRTAARGRRIVLGTVDAPYEPLALGSAPLAALESFEGLSIVVTTRSPEIVEHLELLAELDQRHAILVDVLIASLNPASPDLRERLRAVAALAAEGLTTRLIVAEPNDAADHDDRDAEAGIRRFFAAALESQAFDVALDGLSPTWNRTFDRLRLEYGFPRALPGRG